MKNKNKFALLSFALVAALISTACGGKSSSPKPVSESSYVPSETSNPSDGSESTTSSSNSGESSSSIGPSSSSSSSSSEVQTEFTVRFLVDGVVVQSSVVQKGELAVYEGPTPTKEPDAVASRYRFKGWDKDLATPITHDTDFNAVFSRYLNEVFIDNFESYEDSPSMIDEGWVAIGYKNNAWTEETAATVSLSKKPYAGNQALRFDAWENDMWYKIGKHITLGTYPTEAVNAFMFSLMVPSLGDLQMKLILYATVNIGGTPTTVPFYYYPAPQTSDYVEYTIPINDSGWKLYEEDGKTIASSAAWCGINAEDIIQYLTKIEICIHGNDHASGQSYCAFLDEVKFVNLDNPTYSEKEKITPYFTYTGELASGNVLKVDINPDYSATAKIIDLEVPQEIPGNVVINDKNITFTSADGGASLVYTGRLTNGGQKVAYVSASGTYMNAVRNMTLNAVQTVENFEGYTEDGVSWYKENTANDRTGFRSNFYAEYYSNNADDNSPWGGSKWSLMDADGEFSLVNNPSGAHRGNNYLAFKNANNHGNRLMQWGLFDGSAERNTFRGSKMSFWAKTSGVVKSFWAYMYSQPAPTNATRDVQVKKVNFKETTAVADWKHYEVELDPNKIYYGYMFFIDASWAGVSTLYIDDIEIYSADPYATYVAPPEPEPVGLVATGTYTAKLASVLNAGIMVNDDSHVTMAVPGFNLFVSGTYVVEDDEVTITGEGITYVATIENDNKTLTFKSISGESDIAQMFDGASFNLADVVENAELYDGNGQMFCLGNETESNLSGARGAYYCDVYNGNTNNSSPVGGSKWKLMDAPGDQIEIDDTTFFDGGHSLKLKNGNNGNYRYVQWDLYKGTTVGRKGVNRFSVYLKNDNDYVAKVKLMVYKTPQITSSTQGADYRKEINVDIPAHTDWTRYTVELDENTTYYGWAILFTSDWNHNMWINLDCAYFYRFEEDPSLMFYGLEDVVLISTSSAIDASLKFGAGNKIYLTCEALNADNVAGTYDMVMDGADQIMTIKVAGSTITGQYAINYHGDIAFLVTGVEGDLASQIPTGIFFGCSL